MSSRVAIALWAAVLILGLVFLLSGNPNPSSQSAANAKRAKHQAAARAVLERATQVMPQAGNTVPHARVARASRREIDRQDTYLHSPQGERQLEQQQRQAPAYDHLPYRSAEVQIEIANVTSDGRVVLMVTPLGLNVDPHRAYRRFLERYHDPGSFFLAEYARFQP